MKLLTDKLLFALFTMISALAFAQPGGGPPGGGGGVVGPGAPASPIDNYLYVLILVSISFFVYYAIQMKKTKTTN